MNELAVLPIALLVGGLIGSFGIGGVLLVPALALAGVPVHSAIAAAMFGYLFTGAVGSWAYARQGEIGWTDALWLGAGAFPAAFVGALLADLLESRILELLLAILLLLAAASQLLKAPARGQARRLASGRLVLLGLAVGVGSAATGTGGPVLLLPLLLALGCGIRAVIGFSQVIQLPIAAAATIGNLLVGALDLRLAALLSLGLCLGAAAGACSASRIPAKHLGACTLALMFILGLVMVLKALSPEPWLLP